METKKSLLKSLFPYIIIVALALIIFMQRSCNPATPIPNTNTPSVTINGQKFDVQKHDIDTQWVPTPPQIVYRPGKVIHKDSIIYVEIPPCDDTMAMLKDYFAKKIYSDTLKLNDSLGFIAVRDTINQNSILNRKWYTHINKMVISDTIYLSPAARTQWYIGGLIGAHKPNTTMVGASILIKNKKDQLYGVNAGYTSNLNLFVQGTMLWKIKLKRKQL